MKPNRSDQQPSAALNHDECPNSLDMLRHPIECVTFVRKSLQVAQDDKALSPRRVANARGLCRVLLEMSVDEFGADGKQVLIGWGIERSEDVGLIVYRLIDANLVRQSTQDSLADFNGLFDLSLPPDEWELKW